MQENNILIKYIALSDNENLYLKMRGSFLWQGKLKIKHLLAHYDIHLPRASNTNYTCAE
jgi:hypothetical protein